MEALQMSTWNDNRLDELSGRTDTGFKEVKAEIQDVRAEMRAGFTRVDGEIKEVRAEMRDGFARVDKRFEKVEGEMKDGFARVDQRFETVDQRFEKVDQRFEKVDREFKAVREEMKEGFAQTVTRAEMNERFNAVDKRLGDLTRWVQALVVVVGGAFVSNGLLG